MVHKLLKSEKRLLTIEDNTLPETKCSVHNECNIYPPHTVSCRSPAALFRGMKQSIDEDTEGGRITSEGEGLVEQSRINSQSPLQQLLDDDEDDDPDDPCNQYARIEDMQKYVLMSSSPATLPKTPSSTTAEGDTVDLGKKSQTLSRSGKELTPTVTSAPLLPWKRKWKKQCNGPIVHSKTISTLPPTAVTPSPSHGRKTRPLPPSPIKPRRILTNKTGGGNIYEAIDDLRRQGSSRSKGTEDAWGPPVEPRLAAM